MATKTYSKEKVGTRYLLLGIRTFANPNDPTDLDKLHALRDAIKVEQATGTVEFPNWDPVSQKKVRDALIVLAGTIPDTKNSYNINGTTAKKDADGSITIQFGGCDGKVATAYRSPRAGTIGHVSIVHGKRSLTALTSLQSRSR